MSGRLIVVPIWLVLLGFLPGGLPLAGRGNAFATEKTVPELEAEYDREPNPKRRVNLAVAISDERLKMMLSAYQSADSEKESADAKNYIFAVDRLEAAIHEHSLKGVFKEAEIHLRRQTRALENLRMSLSAAEQPTVDGAIARANKLHEQILYAVMNLEKHE